jgi:hypothetical protein
MYPLTLFPLIGRRDACTTMYPLTLFPLIGRRDACTTMYPLTLFPWLNGLAAAFAGADADAIFQRQDEDFAVADFARAGSGGLRDGFDRRF